MAPTTLPPAERPRVTPPWPRSPSCWTIVTFVKAFELDGVDVDFEGAGGVAGVYRAQHQASTACSA